ncbi:MAG: FtsW/RodA/SpoVE family cell cycle protein [Acetivibrio sp.]
MAEREKQTQRNNDVRGGYYDYSLLFLTLFLVAFGLIMIYSTSSYTAQLTKGDSMYYLKRQGVSAVLGVVGMLIMSKLNYRMFLAKLPIIKIRFVTLIYIIAIALQVYVLLFGVEINYKRRWIDIGKFGTFQPSDLSKVAVILFVSFMIYLAPKEINHFKGFFRIAIYTSPLIILIGKENMSTAIIICLIMGGICFVASKKKGYFVAAVLIMLVGAALFLVFGEGFRLNRFDIWLNVETNKDAFQILQGLYAIASGGLTGKGLGGSMQKLGYVPEAQNDMIFSIICEELGLFGAVTVLILFVLLIWRLFIISINAPDLFGGLLCGGVLIHIASQVIINVAVVTNSIPSTGIPLPFISYGGTSVAVLLGEIGMALSVSNRVRYER